MTNQQHHVGGVDSHKDTIHVAVITERGQPVADAEFPITVAGYRRAVAWLIEHATVDHGNGMFGAGQSIPTVGAGSVPEGCGSIIGSCSFAVGAAVGHPTGSGHDYRSLTDRRSGGAQPYRQSTRPGPLGPAQLMQDLTRSRGRGDDRTGTRDASVTLSSQTPTTVPDQATDR